MPMGQYIGVLPNIYYKSVTMDDLRTHPSIKALPPVESLNLSDPETYRFVRQDSALWQSLHDGILTSGTLGGALGFYEATGIARLGMPHYYENHDRLLQAYENLRKAQHIPETSDEGGSEISARRALFQNRKAVTFYNDQLRRVKHISSSASRAASAHFISRTASRISPQGLQQVQMEWGQAQEPASVLDLATLFPNADVEEVGLYMVNADDIPPHWNIPAGSLPPIGASPDALLRQRSSSSDFEMVEIKNSSPFGIRRSHHFSQSSQPVYNLYDRGPREQVLSTWVPQLQTQMLASGTRSIVLLTRSATKGSNLFRMYRNDEFLRLMLRHIALFQAKYVIPGKPPGHDAFSGDLVYHRLLSKTLEVAAETECIRRIPAEDMPVHSQATEAKLFL